jgi:hypothetical protein
MPPNVVAERFLTVLWISLSRENAPGNDSRHIDGIPSWLRTVFLNAIFTAADD